MHPIIFLKGMWECRNPREILQQYIMKKGAQVEIL